MQIRKPKSESITVKQAIKQSGLTKGIIYAAIYSGRLPAKKIKKHWRVDIGQLLRLTDKKSLVRGEILSKVCRRLDALTADIEVIKADLNLILRDEVQTTLLRKKFKGDE